MNSLSSGRFSITPMVDHSPADRLLAWYDRARRDLPWRALPGERADPYRVWLSEVMLQQTTVEAVRPRFLRFLAEWPSLEALAAAPLEAVLDHWAGLGYYARARNLHHCAQIVVKAHGGRFPEDPDALRRLPGIGAYTAAAIAAIAFDRPVAAVDGNVVRVLARRYGIATPLPAAKREIAARAGELVPRRRAGDFAQALMDLGAMVCIPRAPDCAACPWAAGCVAHREGAPERYPVKAPRRDKPTRRGLAFWLEAEGAVLVRRRPARGLLGGMLELPSSPWVEAGELDRDAALAHAPVAAAWQWHGRPIRHSFTHFHLELALATARLERRPPLAGLWLPRGAVMDRLPTVMRKLARAALA